MSRGLACCTNPQPGGPGDFWSRFSTSSPWYASIQLQGSSASFGPPRLFYFHGTYHILWAFPYPPPGEAPDGRLATPHGTLLIFYKKYSVTITLNFSISCMCLYQRTPFLILIKCTLLMSENTEWASPTLFQNVCSIHRENEMPVFFINKYCFEAVIYSFFWPAPASSLMFITYKRCNCIYIKTYGCAMVKIFLIVKRAIYSENY